VILLPDGLIVVLSSSREDDPEYILRLIGQVITVSLETVKIVNTLPDLGLTKAKSVAAPKTVQ
jgi:hypothetical protein